MVVLPTPVFLFLTALVLIMFAAVTIELCAGCSNRCFAYDFSYACLPLDIFIIYLVAASHILLQFLVMTLGCGEERGAMLRWHETL